MSDLLTPAKTSLQQRRGPGRRSSRARMRALNPRQLAVLRAAPIGVDDASGGDPYKGGRFIYHGADGRVARALWLSGHLEYRQVGFGGQGGLLVTSVTGRAALDEARL
ncbi:hypothetical protein [Methylobacterium brachiatum]|uniref:hypothetical protein n=1 Tax=Methylobacterium brachiatum TaxID=269660 RepID=UPI00244B1C87|nr:hypothetical protein [Methylobacterium brachiatum]MDH2313078.1 hypothetical protein [Methylobacterium brachiatum]